MKLVITELLDLANWLCLQYHGYCTSLNTIEEVWKFLEDK